MMRQLSCILLIFLSLACLASAPVQAAPVAFDWLEAPADAILGTSEFEPIPLLAL